MIASKEIATEISIASEQYIKSLGKVLEAARESCSLEELDRLKKAIGSVVGTLEVDMLWPLYTQHPDLEPENLRDWKDET